MNNPISPATDLSPQTIQDKIFRLTGRPPAMLNSALSEIYETEVKNINRAVKRNPERFPDDFVFQLTDSEVENLRFQYGTAISNLSRSLPYAFTREGANMLSAVLRSDVAVERSVQIMRAFSSLEEKALAAQSTLTPAQQREIQKLVKLKALRGTTDGNPSKRMYMKIYRSIKDHFQVGKYSQVLQSQFDELVNFLGGAWSKIPLEDEKIDPAIITQIMIEDAVQKAIAKTGLHQKTLEEQIEAESHGWYDKHIALRRVIHRDKLNEIARLNGKLTMAGLQGLDEKKPEEFYICEEVFSMLEYLIFNAPKVMDSLLTMRINDLKGQLMMKGGAV